MSSLRQHFQGIKEIVDWSWTLAILCMVGYITLGQLVQLYWAMVFLGGLAASFGLFYNFSCEKLEELDSLDAFELQKAYNSAAIAQDMLTKFANRNPEIAHQTLFVQARKQVTNIRARSNHVFRLRVNEQRQRQSSHQQPAPSPPPSPVQSPKQQSSTYKPPNQSRQSPSSQTPLTRATAQRLTPVEYKIISNPSDYVFVKRYRKKNGKWVDSHYRRKPRR
ncbi:MULTISPECIES: hypothetical protein [Cyanophyceae]|uniref:hypothetical protein n=1 Tax=Cyanophyceae TaxID=3028117 RepID=UPI00168A2A57|nr:hypothetical protein [Trichocoleus sp. FACHB-69]MBD1932770.1 hypothetical protein [Trichocoleus sp. FACHB-69]